MDIFTRNQTNNKTVIIDSFLDQDSLEYFQKNKDLKISIHYLSTENKACHMNQHGMAFNILDPNFMHTAI